jgi:hypothetical protein
VFGVIPPGLGSLDIQGVWLQGIQEVFGAVSQGGGRVGAADEGKGAIVCWVVKGDQGILEGIEPVGHSVVGVAIEVGVPQEPMDHLSTHQ